MIALTQTTALTLLIVAGAGLTSRLQTSEKPLVFRSAPTPEGWPEASPVGKVRVKEYPTYRAAFVSEAPGERPRMDSMFMQLFRHIDSNEIAMTAPVEMSYREADGGPRMSSMAFLYANRELGRVGKQGAVDVRDVAPQSFASVGVRGDYGEENYTRGLALLRAWLADESSGWKAVGPPRYLGYNGPFVPSPLRYGEVQIPVEPRVDPARPASAQGEGRDARSRRSRCGGR